MKSKLLLFLVMFCSSCHAYSPIIDGALADIKVIVVDDMGKVVPNAKVTFVYYYEASRSKSTIVETDKNGIAAAQGNCIGEAYIVVRKDGYYKTRVEYPFSDLAVKEAEKTRRWSKGQAETTVMLKKKHNPIMLSAHLNYYDAFKIPVTNSVVYFDAERFEWCPPYGNGKHKDIEMLYETWFSPERWNWTWRKLTMKFPNCVDGYYCAKLDSYSDFSYAYEANTNAVYQKEFVLELDRRTGEIKKKISLPDDEYMIFRVRSETNELGQVTKAHYGRIGEKASHIFGLQMKTWFNTTENDTNLEDDREIKY